MRVAALYDIHGNLPALEAVLAEVRKFEVDQIVVGGDVVPGPMPGECLECLLHLDLPVKFISGNGEVAVLAELAGNALRFRNSFAKPSAGRGTNYRLHRYRRPPIGQKRYT